MDVDGVLAELKKERSRIDGAIKALEALGSGKTTRVPRSAGNVVRKRKPMSAATRKKLKVAAKARWAARKVKP